MSRFSSHAWRLSPVEGIESTLISLLQLIYGIVIHSLLLLGWEHVGRLHAEGKTHEYAVEPHLISIHGLVPVYTLFGARLLVELLLKSADSDEILLLGEILMHGGHEMTCTHIVEIVVGQVIAAYRAVGTNHRVGIALAIVEDAVVAVAQICVEHRLKLNAHDIAPLGLLGEVEQTALGHTLHLRLREPLAQVAVRSAAQAGACR